MRGRAIIPLVVGLGVGVFAIKLFVDVLQKAKGATGETVPVVCAAADVEPTLEIQETMVEIRQVPKALAPELAFADKKEVVGRVTTLMIGKGMPIIPSVLAPPGTPPGMSTKIPEGYRAVAVQIDESAGVAGWLKPGSRVDVVVMMNIRRGGGQTESISKVILQNVEVLAVGQQLASGDSAANLTRSVTLMVVPEDVSKLHLASTQGKLRLAMRNQRDDSLPKTDITTDNDLLAQASGKSSKPASADDSGVFSRLFGGQAKPALAQTDKPTVARVAEPVAARPQPEPWTVELVSGSGEPKKVLFANDKKGARRVGGDVTPGADRTPVQAKPATKAPAAAPAPRTTPGSPPPSLPDADKVDTLKSTMDNSGSKESSQAQQTETE